MVVGKALQCRAVRGTGLDGLSAGQKATQKREKQLSHFCVKTRAPFEIKEMAERAAYLTVSAVQWTVDPQCIAAAARCPGTGQGIIWTKTVGLKHQSPAVWADVACAPQQSTAQHSTAQHSTAVLFCQSEQSDDCVTHAVANFWLYSYQQCCNQCCTFDCLLST